MDKEIIELYIYFDQKLDAIKDEKSPSPKKETEKKRDLVWKKIKKDIK